jgi:4-alpha-glucanotransferase
LPQQPSPYHPSSRLFRNPLYLSVEAMPGATEDREAINRLAAAARALNEHRLIDRDAVFKLKMAAFERLWKRFRPTHAFERYRAEQGATLATFAVFCTLAERYGTNWHVWPARFRRPTSAAVKRFAVESGRRVGFHQWLQWLLDEQLARAAKHSLLVTDLPVGVDPCGADAWCWQDVLAPDVRVGAPPDQFNNLGQEWGVQPFVPWRLRAARYAPLVEGLRAVFRHAGGLRIDHVMGLFRLFWVPSGLTPDKGVYMAYPSEEMLAVLAVESHRAKAFVVGEDLGTVEPGVRRHLTRHRVLGCAVMLFEKNRPARYRSRTLASVTTHDLPTIAGLWSGDDVRVQRELGLRPPGEDYQRMRRRLCRLTGLSHDSPVRTIIPRVHRELAQGSCLLRVATIDDALGVSERPNMPGTTAGYPNWSLALPVPLDRIRNHPLVGAVANTMAQGHRSRTRMLTAGGGAGRYVVDPVRPAVDAGKSS